MPSARWQALRQESQDSPPVVVSPYPPCSIREIVFAQPVSLCQAGLRAADTGRAQKSAACECRNRFRVSPTYISHSDYEAPARSARGSRQGMLSLIPLFPGQSENFYLSRTGEINHSKGTTQPSNVSMNTTAFGKFCSTLAGGYL